jgi:hypothetical protein
MHILPNLLSGSLFWNNAVHVGKNLRSWLLLDAFKHFKVLNLSNLYTSWRL